MPRRAVLMIFALVVPGALDAQLVPGRDLMAFPIGLTAEAPALGMSAGFGLWNPASLALPEGSRSRFAVGTMSAPVDVAVTGQVASIAVRFRNGTTFGLGLAHASVGDLLRTDSDPQSMGDEIQYSTTLISLLAARRVGPVTIGTAMRVRSGTLDNIRRRAVSFDVGAISRGLGRHDIRLAASTFLASPFSHEHERAELLLAADGRLMGTDSLRTSRAGLSYTVTDGMPREAFGFVSGRWQRLEGRFGIARTEAYGEYNWRERLGVAFHHRGYVIGVAREEGAGNLSATYQFTLSTVLK